MQYLNRRVSLTKQTDAANAAADFCKFLWKRDLVKASFRVVAAKTDDKDW